MAGPLMKRFSLLCVEGLELVLNSKGLNFKGCLYFKTAVNIPRMLCTGQNTGSKTKRLKRIRKNDPEMDYFLHAVQERIKDISKVMECTIEQATELVKRNSSLGIADSHSLFKRIKLLLSYNFSVENILRNPAVIHKNYEVLQQRLETLSELRDPPHQRSLSVLKLSNTVFKVYIQNCIEEDMILSQFSSRQHFLESLFECNEDVAKNLINVYNLDTVSPVLLKSKVEIFERFEIPKSVIRTKIYAVLFKAAPLIESRLQILRDNDFLCHPYIGLTYFLVTPREFNKVLNAMIESRNALEGCSDKTDYFVFRLKCSRKVAEGLANSTQIMAISEVKLKKMLDFFLEEMQMSSGFVVSNVYLMAYSLERMQRRWSYISLSPYNRAKSIPRLLSMSDAQFEKFID